MKRPDYIPEDYKRIKIVSSLSELFNAEFGGPDDVNCILLPRALQGNFNALAHLLGQVDSPSKSALDMILSVQWTHAALKVEREFVRSDIIRAADAIRSRGFAPNLQLRVNSSRKWERQFTPYAFHTDTCKNADFGRLICHYSPLVTEWIRNEDAIPVKEFPGQYRKKENALVFSFLPGDIWRQKSRGHGLPAFEETQDKDSRLFIHRTPEAVQDRKPDDPPRVFLVAGADYPH